MRNSGPGDKTPDAERRTTSPAKSNTFIEIIYITTNLCYNYISQLTHRRREYISGQIHKILIDWLAKVRQKRIFRPYNVEVTKC